MAHWAVCVLQRRRTRRDSIKIRVLYGQVGGLHSFEWEMPGHLPGGLFGGQPGQGGIVFSSATSWSRSMRPLLRAHLQSCMSLFPDIFHAPTGGVGARQAHATSSRTSWDWSGSSSCAWGRAPCWCWATSTWRVPGRGRARFRESHPIALDDFVLQYWGSSRGQLVESMDPPPPGGSSG